MVELKVFVPVNVLFADIVIQLAVTVLKFTNLSPLMALKALRTGIVVEPKLTTVAFVSPM